MCVCVCVCVCMSVCLFVSLCVYVPACVFIHLAIDNLLLSTYRWSYKLIILCLIVSMCLSKCVYLLNILSNDYQIIFICEAMRVYLFVLSPIMLCTYILN